MSPSERREQLSRTTPALFTSTSMRPARSANCSTPPGTRRRDVDLRALDVMAGVVQRCDDVLRGWRVAAVEERDVRAFTGEELDDRAADAAAAACHEHRLARQYRWHHWRSPHAGSFAAALPPEGAHFAPWGGPAALIIPRCRSRRRRRAYAR
jgi:hypothetical protein